MAQEGLVPQVKARVSLDDSLSVKATEVLEKINKHTLEPLSAAEVFVFMAVPSTNLLDTYFTRMSERSLKNYAHDLKEGRALVNSHVWRQLPLGYSFDARFDSEAVQTEAWYYLQRNLKVTDVNTDDVIRAIKSGTVRDVSLGFIPGWYKCGICGKDIRNKECSHVPGLTYDDVLAFAWVEGAHAVETSLVYDGATPGAIIKKAAEFVEKGLIEPADVDRLEGTFQVRFPKPRPKPLDVWVSDWVGNFDTFDIEARPVDGGWDETPNQWRYRVRNPKDFIPETFRNLKITNGVILTLGKLKTEGKGGSMKVQSIGFDKKIFPKLSDAKKWLDAHPELKEKRSEEIFLSIDEKEEEVRAWVAIPYKKMPLAPVDEPWSFTASEGNAILGDPPNWERYKSCHGLFDNTEGSVPEIKGAYKYPHHKIYQGTLKTFWRGVAAAVVRATQQGVLNIMKSHLSSHYAEFDKTPPWERKSFEEVVARGVEIVEKDGVLYYAFDGKQYADDGVRLTIVEGGAEVAKENIQKISEIASQIMIDADVGDVAKEEVLKEIEKTLESLLATREELSAERYCHPEDKELRKALGEYASPGKVKDLLVDGSHGRQYREDLIKEAVSMRIRAQGDSFDKDKYENFLRQSQDIEFIKSELSSYEKASQKVFTSGRQIPVEDKKERVGRVQIEENIFRKGDKSTKKKGG